MRKFNLSFEHQRACHESLQWIKEHIPLDDNNELQISLSIEWFAARQVLIQAMRVIPPIPHSTKERVLRPALTRWRQAEEVSSSPQLLKTFQRILQTELGALEDKKTPYSVLMFLNIADDQAISFPSLSIRGLSLHFRSWENLAHLETEQLWAEVSGSGYETSILQIFPSEPEGLIYIPRTYDFTPVLVELETYDEGAAVAVAGECFDLLRSMFNLFLALQTRMRFGGEGKPLSTYLPSPIYGVFDNRGKLLSVHHTIEHYSYRRQSIEEWHMQSVLGLNDRLNAATPGMVSFLERLLQLYQQALDFTDAAAVYLALWQVLEALTLSEPGEKNQIDTRVGTLLQLHSGDILRAALDVLTASRNRFVHSGVFPNRPNELVFTLKMVVDRALLKMFNLSEQLSSDDELREYFAYVSKGNTDLEREKEKIATKRRVIQLIQDSRRK